MAKSAVYEPVAGAHGAAELHDKLALAARTAINRVWDDIETIRAALPSADRTEFAADVRDIFETAIEVADDPVGLSLLERTIDAAVVKWQLYLAVVAEPRAVDQFAASVRAHLEASAPRHTS